MHAAVLVGGEGQEDGAALAVALPEQPVAVGLGARGRQLRVQSGNRDPDDQGVRGGGLAVPAGVPHERHFHVTGEALNRLYFHVKLCPILQRVDPINYCNRLILLQPTRVICRDYHRWVGAVTTQLDLGMGEDFKLNVDE